ncbi:MAG: S8 family serine peptidase, partial [Lachnospiraceae bacterium]|nr:S8 family serine peptidase [Lachnospiraceae bacterium]
MKKFFKTKPFLGLLLALSLVATSLAPLSTVDAVETTETGKKYAFEKVDNDVIKSTAKNTDVFNVEASEMQFADDEQVRVSIVLDGTSVVDAGYSTEDLPENAAALDLIEEVLDEQKVMEEKIADEVNIDVKWNLTVAANIISADVAYGDIEAIENIDGVKEVIVETKYLPCSPVDAADPEMVISQTDMTGVSEAWAKGQTGAGGRIAIIDTGFDITHQSLNNDPFLYALQEDARWNLYKNFNAYLNKIDLLDAKDIEKVLPLLNSYATLNGNVSAEDFIISDKIAYAFNYVDEDFNVEHIYDGQGEHGSHVAGIATANRYLKTEDGFVDALDTVYVAGNAPDAQILVMKVFGVGGGAYDSDYMAAIEDAILLGCDSVNLSLGSSAPGFTVSTDYQEIMNKLTASDTVVVISAGNAGAWADQTTYGELYYDGVSYMTAGSPGTFTNALTVASVDNDGAIGKVIEVAGNTVPYSESTTYGNKPLDTLAGDADSAEVEYVFINGFGQATDYEGIDVAGKVVFCSRGTTSFFEKANIAASLGAAATIIYNNTTGTIGLNLTGYEYSAPCVSIKLDDAAVIREASEAQTTADGVTYYTGKVTIKKGLTPVIYNSDHYQMSSFSSWGVPGNLSIKPEITAPGGGIYSVFGSCDIGGGPDQYELMSGTSMAAPQVTGMMAVLKRYVETSWYKKFPNVSHRAIAQSLLMSTATPMVDADGNVYPVMQQGAGLANVNNAINAASFVMMDENSTVSAKDGKVKAELGDDPAKKGEYKVSFTLTNLTPTSHTYKLDEYVFTQALDGVFLTKGTEKLDADVTYYVDGKK